MIIMLKKYDFTTKTWLPTVPAKFLSTRARVNKGYVLDSYYFKYPYGNGDCVAPTCLAKWIG
jgi:hypothetical protein